MNVELRRPEKMRRDPNILFDVRQEEAATVARFSVDGSFVNILNAILAVICIWSNEQAYMLLSWLAGSTIIFLVGMVNAIRHLRNLPEYIDRKLIWETVFLTVLTGLPWLILTFLTLGQGNLQTSLFILLTCLGLVSGGAMVLYRMPLLAFFYLATMLLGPAVVLSVGAFADLSLLLIVMLNFGVMMGITAVRAWRIARDREEGLKSASSENKLLQEANEEIRRLTMLDNLTDLYNRKAFVDILQDKISHIDKSNFAVFLVDLDRFKHINDSLGHAAGDELLKVVADRMNNAVSEEDVIARFGGDEFALLISNCNCKKAATQVANRIIARLNEPVTIQGTVIHPNASIGITFHPEHSKNPDELVCLADIALHHAKEKGRGRSEVYSQVMAISMKQTDELANIIREAIESKELKVLYQPKIDLRSMEIVGAEALLRCYKDTGEVIPTKTILEAAEDRGLIPQISDYVFQTITSDKKECQKRNIRPIPVSINLHSYELKAPEVLISQLNKMFDQGVNRHEILLEVTENCLVGRGSDAASTTLDLIDEMGIKLSLDDFGTGHAALSHLKRLPVSELKVDREFIHGLCDDHRDRAITIAALEITKCLGVSCVAEGVETEEQLQMLKELNTEGMSIIGQGHYWAPAMTVDEFIQYYASYNKTLYAKEA